MVVLIFLFMQGIVLECEVAKSSILNYFLCPQAALFKSKQHYTLEISDTTSVKQGL